MDRYYYVLSVFVLMAISSAMIFSTSDLEKKIVYIGVSIIFFLGMILIALGSIFAQLK